MVWIVTCTHEVASDCRLLYIAVFGSTPSCEKVSNYNTRGERNRNNLGSVDIR